MILWCYSMKKRRVCLVFNNEFYQKLRSIQSDKIKETNRALSLSQLVEDLVKNGMENESIAQISKWFSEISSKLYYNVLQSIPSRYMMLIPCSCMSKNRVCLLFSTETYLKLRIFQADKIKKTKSSVSFSQLVEDLVKHGMENKTWKDGSQ